MLARLASMLSICLLAAQSAFAQPAPSVAPGPVYAARGTMEAEAGLALGYPRGGDWDVMFAPGFRYFVLNGLAVGVTFRAGYLGGPGATDLQAAAVVEYDHSLGSTWYPYVGAGFGGDYWSYKPCVTVFGTETCFDKSAASYLVDLEVGVKKVLARHMALGVGVDVPLAFREAKTGFLVNGLGRFEYLF